MAAFTARMLHGDPHHTHRARGRGPGRAEVAWVYEAGGPVVAQVTAAPDESALYIASFGGTLAAVSRDGVRKWSVALAGRVYSSPCVAADGTIFIGSDGGAFYAVDPGGHIRWKLETRADADTSAVLTPAGDVIFAAGQAIYDVSATGTVRWRFNAQRKLFTSPALTAGGLIVIGSQDHHVYALTTAGKLAWKVDLAADVDGAPVVGDDGAIYVGTDAGEVVRLDDTGRISFRTKLGGFVRGPLAIARNGDVLAGVYGPIARIVRLAPSDGTIRWEFRVPGTGAREFGVHGGALEDEEGALFFGGQDDAVHALDARGIERWRFATGGDVDAPLTLLSDGSLVVPSDEGRVYLLKP